MGWGTMSEIKKPYRPKLTRREASIIESQIRTYTAYRLNIFRNLLPLEIIEVTVMIDMGRKRIGIFKCNSVEGNVRKLSNYGKKSKVAYISLPNSVITQLGFTVGRYKILRKSSDPNMYFYLSLKKKIS